MKQGPQLFLFALTLFLSAGLMFAVQPMTGKMLLPLVGGTPSGWVVAMAFFQIVLLGGYGLANYLSRLTPREHGAAFAGILLLGALFLPVEMKPQAGEANALMVIRLLAVTVGVPFFALSLASSTLQRLFSAAGGKFSADPYFLYAASNLGSFAGLLLYPFVAETAFTIPEQSRLWLGGYILLFALACFCVSLSGKGQAEKKQTAAKPLPLKTRLEWIVLAFIPSSLLLGVTMHITTEVIAVPLLWVAPLGLYLMTFVLAFGRGSLVPLDFLYKVHPFFVSTALALIMLATDKLGASWYAMGWHMLAFFGIALMCHTRLAALRPDSRHLTDYYLMLAVGGALGGILNAFIAPLVFNRLVEYPLVLALTALVNPLFKTRYDMRYFIYTMVGVAIVAVLGVMQRMNATLDIRDAVLLIMFAAVTLHPRALLAGAAVLAVVVPVFMSPSKNLVTSRNFFGVIKTYDMQALQDGKEVTVRVFQHGTTLHGTQILSGPMELQPTAYYGKASPVGETFDILKPKKIAVIGLGAGTIACYATPSREFTFLEIDPAVIDMAEHRFTYLEKCKGAKPHRLITGDGRLELSKLNDKFDLIVLDAFSSDMVPVHILALEAIELYKQHLAKGGMLAFHISSQFISLSDTLAAAAKAAGLEARVKHQTKADRPIQTPSVWFVMARPGFEWKAFDKNEWKKPAQTATRPWTDTYSNIISVIKF